MIIADTVAFILTHIPFLHSYQDLFLKQTVADLLHLIKNKDKLNIPRVMFGDKIRKKITEIAELLKRKNIPQLKYYAEN